MSLTKDITDKKVNFEFNKEFINVFQLPDELLLLPIYSAGEKEIEGVTAEKLIKGIEVKTSKKVDLAVAAWGNKGSHLNRDKEVKKIIPNLKCLKINKSGQPAHPLYQKKDLKLIKYS